MTVISGRDGVRYEFHWLGAERITMVRLDGGGDHARWPTDALVTMWVGADVQLEIFKDGRAMYRVASK